MNAQLFCSFIIAAFCVSSAAAQQDNRPPAGFSALFNGENLDGWIGQRNINPYELAELTDDERAKMRAEDRQNMQQH